MDDKSLYSDACIFFIVFFALILFCSIGGIFYGIAKESREYIWTGGIFAIIALGVEILTGCYFYKRKITDKEKESKNEDKNH
ncbi:MAG: hypothetical protein ACKKMS_03465 [Candidatus Nealsonbacteria bacterium]